MSDVRAKSEAGVTLLHTIAQIIEENEPELLGFIDELPSVKHAESGKDNAPHPHSSHSLPFLPHY